MASLVSTVRRAGLIATAAPVLGAIVIRWMVGSQPLDVGADSVQMQPPPPETMLTPRLTQRQRDARDFALTSMEQPFGSSPMTRTVVRPVVIEAGPVVVDPQEPDVEQTTVPAFDVTSILVSSRHQLATINGKLYRIGDEIAPGWRLKTIDSVRGVVVIVPETGASVEAPVRSLDR